MRIDTLLHVAKFPARAAIGLQTKSSILSIPCCGFRPTHYAYLTSSREDSYGEFAATNFEEIPMTRSLWLPIVALATSAALPAQTANPIVSSAKEIYVQQEKYIVAAFEEMPTEKYSYSPTTQQMSFAKLATHIVLANHHVCAMLSGSPAPETAKLSESDSKETLISAVKDSFAFCDKAVDGLQDSQLGDTITFFGGAKKPRARALFELTGDLEDHYSQMAGYLRLNGLTPPSASSHR
jgi:uncharacterized damage-inducible protein DinB